MPVYDYRCGKCSKKFSLTMTISDHDKRNVKCPKCGSRKVEQQVAAFYAVTSKKS
ncbi:MAG: zinc ribbon domain-containing protein [Acidobacteria bacterium]|nr:zinc ribbon domain-containing protein [Acidobacteriota bacterium]